MPSSKIFYWVEIVKFKYCFGQWGALKSKSLRSTDPQTATALSLTYFYIQRKMRG